MRSQRNPNRSMTKMSSEAGVCFRERSKKICRSSKLKCIIHCVVIGDGDIGKTELALRLAAETCDQKFSRRSFIHFSNDIKIKGESVHLKLLDVPDQEEYDTRALFYSQVDVFLLCFSLVNPVSFKNVLSKWYPEIRYFCPNIPVVLVGTKHDLRKNANKIGNHMELRSPYVTYIEGLLMAKEIGAVQYLECSAVTDNGLNDVTLKIIKAASKNSKVSEKNCSCKII